ncbi:MAG: vWA domain-containing protein [Acidimicrobiales bacterium]
MTDGTGPAGGDRDAQTGLDSGSAAGLDGGSAAGDLDGSKVAAARLWATARYPYLASAIFAAPTLPAPGVGRLVIDRWWRIHADPDVVAASTVDQIGGELLHLTSHALRDHAARADELRFSEAAELHHWVDSADAEIADDFPTELDRISPAVRADDLVCRDGRLAEEYYRLGVVREGVENDCGSGAHGAPPPWEPPPPDPDAESSADRGVGQDDQELIRQNVAAEVARAEADAVSAGLRRWATDRLKPTIDWRSELAASLRREISVVAGAVDYSYRRPSRRSSTVDGVVLPALQRPTVEVAVVCDTSASVSDELLGQAMSEVDGLLRATGTRTIRLLACDDAVRTVSRVTSGRDVALLGGGGTDMAIGIDAAMAQRPPPSLIVVLTDGYTPWPAEAPRAKVVVGLLDDESQPPGIAPVQPPDWARTVPISPT